MGEKERKIGWTLKEEWYQIKTLFICFQKGQPNLFESVEHSEEGLKILENERIIEKGILWKEQKGMGWKGYELLLENKSVVPSLVSRMERTDEGTPSYLALKRG